MQKKNYQQEILDLIHSGLPQAELAEKLSDYHENDLADALEALTPNERQKLYTVLGVEPDFAALKKLNAKAGLAAIYEAEEDAPLIGRSSREARAFQPNWSNSTRRRVPRRHREETRNNVLTAVEILSRARLVARHRAAARARGRRICSHHVCLPVGCRATP